MECSTDSWFFKSGMNQCDMMGSMENQLYNDDQFLNLTHEDLTDILGENFLNTLSSSPQSPSILINDPHGGFALSPSTLINDPNGGFTNEPQQVSLEPPQATTFDPPVNRQKNVDRTSNAPIILDFGKQNFPKKVNQSKRPLNPDEEAAVSEILRNERSPLNTEEVSVQMMNKNSRDRPQSQTYDHIISERKRRKLLSEQFLTLSGMVPGLKKMDKTSVLGETIKYLQNLQERMEIMEEKLTRETVESVVLIRKSQVMVEEEESSAENSSCGSYKQPLPEIEAKVCNNQALLRIHCEKQKGVMMKILGEVEKLNLIVLHSNASQFGNLALNITIVVEKEKGSTIKANEIVQALHSTLRTVA